MSFRASDNAVPASHGQFIAKAAIEGEVAHPVEFLSETPASALAVGGAGALLFVCFGTAYAIPVFFQSSSRHCVETWRYRCRI